MAKQKTTISQDLEIRISVNALRNLNEITGYIAFINQQPLNSIKIGDNFFSALDKIQQNPFAYKECIELATKHKIYRQSKFYSWLIIYKITSTEIIILGLIHGARKPKLVSALKKNK